MQNKYRKAVSNMDKSQTRCLDIAHESLEKIPLEQEIKETKKNKRKGIPPKYTNIEINKNCKDITEYFITKK